MSIVTWVSFVAGPATGVGAGACVVGIGGAVDVTDVEGPFVGANAGLVSPGVYDQNEPTADEMAAYYKADGTADDGWPSDFSGAMSFQGQCCRESDLPPGCFAPVG